jgi:predicted transcriptional regulator
MRTKSIMVSDRASYSSLGLLMRTDCSCKDVFCCLYNLSSSEINLLNVLLKSNNPSTLEYLANKLSKDKGTIFRALQKLVSLNLCTKEARTLEGGGYYHVYSAVDVGTIESSVEQRIKQIQRALNRIRRSFKEDIIKMTLAN